MRTQFSQRKPVSRHTPLLRTSTSLLIASLLCILSIVAGAQEQRVALVIGNGQYEHNATLVNPPNDATDMATALQKDGFTVTLLTNASRKAMEQAVRAFGNSLKTPDAVGLFYYSGHGAQADGENFLIPVDADIQAADELPYNAVDAESILAKMRSAGNKINIVIMDACRDNPFPGASRSAERGLAVVRVKVPESVIVYATDPGSTASDGTGRNSPFTKAFLENMDAPGQDITEMMKRLTSRVQTDTDGKQTPWVSTNLTKDFAFKPGSVSVAARTAPPAATPMLSVTRTYGSLSITTATAGTLYLDGRAMGDLPAGAKAKLESVEVGERSLEVRYSDGQTEAKTVTVVSDQNAAVAFGYVQARPTTKDPVEKKKYMVGDAGPAGGIVFYDKGSSEDGWEFLEVARKDLGRMNWTLALQACQDFNGGGASDWKLPDNKELVYLYQNLQQKGMGGFSSDAYWSSSEYDSGNAYRMHFERNEWLGKETYHIKQDNSGGWVRPIRAF